VFPQRQPKTISCIAVLLIRRWESWEGLVAVYASLEISLVVHIYFIVLKNSKERLMGELDAEVILAISIKNYMGGDRYNSKNEMEA